MTKWVYIVHKLDALSNWSGKVTSLLIYVIMGVIIFEVVSRYVFDSPTIWGTETATMVFGVFGLASGVYTHFCRAHVKMDVFYARWSERKKAIADACTFPLFLIFCAVFLWKSGLYAWDSCAGLEHSTTAWGPPSYPWKMTIPVIVFLMILQGISQFIRDISLAAGKRLP